MSSVRARIDAFELLSNSSSNSSKKSDECEPAVGDSAKKRFRFPGKKSIPNESNEAAISNQFNQVFKSSPRRTGDFEADLQQVWSVRKNIHHKGGLTNFHSKATSPSSTSNSGASYSRHGVIPTHPASGESTAAFGRGMYRETRRAPLEENKWNAKRGSYSYNRDKTSSVGDSKQKNDNLVSYAKRMSQGYLKSVGMGEYTPKNDSYVKEQVPPRSPRSPNRGTRSSRWKMKQEDDGDFEFDDV